MAPVFSWISGFQILSSLHRVIGVIRGKNFQFGWSRSRVPR